jgi:hypothetical protein
MKRLGLVAITAALLAAPAMAQLVKEYGGKVLKRDELRTALFGIEMEGYSPTSNMSWRECVDPQGETFYEIPGSALNGRLMISPEGKACFSYEDDDYSTVGCYVVKRSDKGLRFEGDYLNSVFITTRVTTGIKSCKPSDLIG